MTGTKITRKERLRRMQQEAATTAGLDRASAPAA
jgi:hypothetical protein